MNICMLYFFVTVFGIECFDLRSNDGICVVVMVQLTNQCNISVLSNCNKCYHVNSQHVGNLDLFVYVDSYIKFIKIMIN